MCIWHHEILSLDEFSVLNDHFCILIQIEKVLVELLSKRNFERWRLKFRIQNLLRMSKVILIWFCGVYFSSLMRLLFTLLEFMFPSSYSFQYFLTLVFTTCVSLLFSDSFYFNCFIIFDHNSFLFIFKEYIVKVLSDQALIDNFYLISWNCLWSWLQVPWRLSSGWTVFNHFRKLWSWERENVLLWVWKFSHVSEAWVSDWKVSNVLAYVHSTWVCKLLDHIWKLVFPIVSFLDRFWVMIFQSYIMINPWSIFRQFTHIFNLLNKILWKHFIFNTFIKERTRGVMNTPKIFNSSFLLRIFFLLMHNVLLLWVPLQLLSLYIFEHVFALGQIYIIRKNFWVGFIKSDYLRKPGYLLWFFVKSL